MLDLPLEKILDYRGNRYELARACMEYAKCIRYMNKEETYGPETKEVLIAIKEVLENKIKYTSDKFQIEIHQDEIEFMKTFKGIEKSKATDPAPETALETDVPLEEGISTEALVADEEDDQPYANPDVLAQKKLTATDDKTEAVEIANLKLTDDLDAADDLEYADDLEPADELESEEPTKSTKSTKDTKLAKKS